MSDIHMTRDNAQTVINELFDEFGIPQSVPFMGNIWARARDGLVTQFRAKGREAFAMQFTRLVAAIEVLARDAAPR